MLRAAPWPSGNAKRDGSRERRLPVLIEGVGGPSRHLRCADASSRTTAAAIQRALRAHKRDGVISRGQSAHRLWEGAQAGPSGAAVCCGARIPPGALPEA